MSDILTTKDGPGRVRLVKSAEGGTRRAAAELAALWETAWFQDNVKGKSRDHDRGAMVAAIQSDFGFTAEQAAFLADLVIAVRAFMLLGRAFGREVLDPLDEG